LDGPASTVQPRAHAGIPAHAQSVSLVSFRSGAVKEQGAGRAWQVAELGAAWSHNPPEFHTSRL